MLHVNQIDNRRCKLRRAGGEVVELKTQRKKAAPIAERGSFEDGEHRGLRLKILRL